MASIEANGITIEYEVHGEGTPLLLVMGLGGQLVDWPVDLVELFVDQGFQVIRYDNRDAGLSTEFDWKTPSRLKMMLYFLFRRKPKVGYRVDDMADDGMALLGALGLDGAHVVGASMGGMIAQSMAIHHPDKVWSLTSIMSNTGDGKSGNISPRLMAKMARMDPPNRENAVQTLVDGGRLISGPHFDEKIARESAERDLARSWRPEGVNRQTAAIAASPDRTEMLGHLTAPTLVIHGLLDPLVTRSGGVATAKAVPGSRLLEFPDMAHDLPRPRWDEIVGAIVTNTKRHTPVTV